MTWLAAFLGMCACVGSTALVLQAVLVRRFLRSPPPRPRRRSGISILKPLCGLDDGLTESLELFARLPYEPFELLLGVKDANDPAFALAQACARAHPHVRLVLQRGAPGLNPKVNQLVTLATAARYEIFVVSDSNVRVPPHYLDEIAAAFEDPQVGCVTHPVGGGGHRTVGSLLDNLHMGSCTGAAQVGAKCLVGKDLVVGKSMAMRREDLNDLGGFAAFRDYLAEDYVFGQRVSAQLGKRVVIARTAAVNHSERRTVEDFARRYMRWSVIHRTAVRPATYFAQALMNPLPLAVLAVALAPSARGLWALAALFVGKAWVDIATARAISGGGFAFLDVWAVWLKDAILFLAWVRGLGSRTVVWRGNLLRVEQGSRLVA